MAARAIDVSDTSEEGDRGSDKMPHFLRGTFREMLAVPSEKIPEEESTSSHSLSSMVNVLDVELQSQIEINRETENSRSLLRSAAPVNPQLAGLCADSGSPVSPEEQVYLADKLASAGSDRDEVLPGSPLEYGLFELHHCKKSSLSSPISSCSAVCSPQVQSGTIQSQPPRM